MSNQCSYKWHEVLHKKCHLIYGLLSDKEQLNFITWSSFASHSHTCWLALNTIVQRLHALQYGWITGVVAFYVSQMYEIIGSVLRWVSPWPHWSASLMHYVLSMVLKPFNATALCFLKSSRQACGFTVCFLRHLFASITNNLYLRVVWDTVYHIFCCCEF